MDATVPAGAGDSDLVGRQARPVPGVDNGFIAGYRVRFDEAGPDGRMRVSSLLRYAQDIAWRHSEQVGFDRDWYASRGLGWVVRGVELGLHQPVPMGHVLRLSTAVVGHRRIWARRMVACHLGDGRLAARVTTDWVLLDARNRIVRIPDDFGHAFPNPELAGEILRVPAPDGPPAHYLALAVRSRDLDPLGHVNNAVYVDWLAEAVEAAGSGEAGEGGDGWPDGSPAAGPPVAPGASRWRVEYAASAARGDEVAVELRGGPGAWAARIRRADGLDLVRASCTPGPAPLDGG